MAVSPKISVEKVRESLIGEGRLIPTSFGEKPLIYADYTASGRALGFIEDTIRERVLPFYANTHTETSYTGAQSTAYREQARAIIREAVNGNDDDQIIFCGAGATSAVNKLIDIMGLRSGQKTSENDTPVVFIGPYEHHSNELPWRESRADVVVIPLNSAGQLDCSALEAQLTRFASRALKIGSFSAASNVTGVKTDTLAVSALLHAHGAYSLWDYAAAAPYVAIDMNPEANTDLLAPESGALDQSKDAVFLSPHKLVGGPGTPGVLIMKRKLMTNTVPAMPGGGTVVYVTPQDHTFIEDPQRREEGGTPAIVEAIRAGLVFKLQQEIGLDTIEANEEGFRQRALARWTNHPNIEVLGGADNDSLAIFSLRIKHAVSAPPSTTPAPAEPRDLHYGFVVALLNDLFGIQARGGCSCAGPYGHQLLGMSMQTSRAIESEIRGGQMILRPGWVRLNFNYFIDTATADYLMHAVELVADYGWRLLPYYAFDASSATWRFQDCAMQLGPNLAALNLAEAVPSSAAAFDSSSLPAYLEEAHRELTKRRESAKTYSLTLPPSAEALRWFVLPQEIALDEQAPDARLRPLGEKGAA